MLKDSLKITKLPIHLFDWQVWRAGCISDLGIPTNRKEVIIEHRKLIKEYAIGYQDGERLLCRPKVNHKAIMFYKDRIHFWQHLTNEEFESIWR